LGQVGGLTTTTIAGSLVGVPSLSGDGNAEVVVAESLTSRRENRADQAMQLRHQAAEAQRKLALPPQPVNGDEELYPNRIASFTKGLPHNELGEVNLRAYESLLQSLKTSKQDDYELIPLGGNVKLANPQAALAFEMVGNDPHYLSMPPPPAFNSAEMAAEMVELYWQAVTRDTHFSEYNENRLTNQAAIELSNLFAFRGPKNSERVTPAILFRGNTPGDLTGPYLSQFLWLDIPYGAMTIQQRYRVPQAETDHMRNYEEWLNIQNGVTVTSGWLDESIRYLRNGRDLAAYVHKNFTYQAYLNAALILLSWGQPALDPNNPYVGSATQGAFCTFGGPYILDLVARVANSALKTAWYQKWYLHRRIRPEEFGGCIQNQKNKTVGYDLHPEVLNASVLDIVFDKHESYLLPQAYPEGCPTHPAYPSGHAIIAGACTTVLKAFFNESLLIPNPVITNSDGSMLEQYSQAALRVGGELNKLASNIAFGCNVAGIHWRSDAIEGMKLGEAVAIGIMADLKPTFHEPFKGFRLTKFDGTAVVI
jgi:membrane-associated phospholipid phosphatase